MQWAAALLQAFQGSALLMSKLAEAASYKVVWQPRQVVYGIYREIAIAVVKGNAAMFASNARKCQFAEFDA